MCKKVYAFLPPDQGPSAPPQVYGSAKRAVTAALGYGCQPVGVTELGHHLAELDCSGRTLVDKGKVVPSIAVYRVTLR